MTAVVAIRPGVSLARRAPLSGLEASIEQIDEHLDNLKRCIHWLFAERIAVLQVDMRRERARPQITVAAHPRLYITCKDDCANVGRKQDGACVRHLWTAQRHGCQLWWEEVECA